MEERDTNIYLYIHINNRGACVSSEAIRDECVMINKNKGTRNTLVNYASRMHLIKALRQQDCANRFFQNVDANVYYISVSSVFHPFPTSWLAQIILNLFEEIHPPFLSLSLSFSLNRKRTY